MAPLNHKQKKFALEYRVDHNATEAALRAGYSSRGASTQGARLLANAEIRKLIDAADAKVLEKVEAKGDRVLAELGHIGFQDPIGIFNTDGTLKHLETMAPEVRRTIKSLEFEELWEGNHANDKDGESAGRFVAGRIVKITFWDKVKGLELLGKNQKLWTEKIEVTADESLASLLAQARRPATDEDDEDA